MTTVATIALRAAENNLPFLLAGGHAVIAHGHSRSTFDIDLVIQRGDLNRWKALALEMGYKLLHEGPIFSQFEAPTEKAAPLDFMIVNEQTFSKLALEATPAPGDSGGSSGRFPAAFARHEMSRKQARWPTPACEGC